MGLADTGNQRKVAGLRREEVAELASISTDYYTRVEQGRMQASVPVLEAVAHALRLTGDQRTYLFELAGRAPAEPPARPERAVGAHTRRLLDQLTASPALVLSDAMDVLAWNRLAAALLTDFEQVPETDRNYVWLLFNDPTLRALYDDWESGAQPASRICACTPPAARTTPVFAHSWPGWPLIRTSSAGGRRARSLSRARGTRCSTIPWPALSPWTGTR